MGSNQFQREYIEYLQKRNTELLNRLNDMKESYENRILSRDLNKDYLISTLEDALNIFTAIPQEIDVFFDKITAAMGAFKNILLRKSEMLQLTNKISKALNSNDNFNSKVMQMDDSVLMKNQFPESTISKKAGTVKVSPMINGHIISTEPRIYLSRVPGVFPSSRRSETQQLSPIIEASPDTSLDQSTVACHVLKEIKIPLERLNINKMAYNYISEESPKTRFKGPKIWKKSLSSNRRRSDFQRKSVFSENNENVNKKLSFGESELIRKSDNIDPLEGPSWLYEESTEGNSSRFTDYRRRKHRFATVFDKNEDCCSYVGKKPKESSQQDLNEFHENHKEENDEEEDLEKIKERLSDSSEDFIYTSLSSDSSENISPFEKDRRIRRRESTKAGSCEKADKEFRNETSRGKIKKRKTISITPLYSDSSDEEQNERKISRSGTKERKSSRKQHKSTRESVSKRISVENTPSTPGNHALDELDNSVNEEKISKRLKKGNRTEKKMSKKSKSTSKSRSPSSVFVECEGRMKRKAAPTKLIEPTLKGKLRRN